MTQSEFNILITNVTAIASQIFSLQCGEFATAMSANENASATIAPFELEQHLNNINFQEILDSGYNSLDSLTTELNEAWGKHDTATLAALLQQLTTDLPVLTQKLTGIKLKQWIKYNLKPENADSFYALHQYVMPLFNQFGDETYDAIREAIAFDDLAGLLEHEQNIQSKHIKLDDLTTAATIESFKVFEWLLQRTRLEDKQVADILENCFNHQPKFERVYTILAPTAPQHKVVMFRAQAANQASIINFLSQIKPG